MREKGSEMKSKWKGIAAAALLAAVGAVSAEAGSVAVVTKSVPANGDLLIGVPVNKAVVETVTVSSVSSDDVTISVPAADYGDGTYYIRVLDGAGRGLWSTITATAGGSDQILTIASEDIADQLSTGDTLQIMSHQTIGDIFPDSLRDVSFVEGTQILVYNNQSSTLAQNPGAADIVTYTVTVFPVSFEGWTGAQGPDTILPPDTQIIVRNNSANAGLVVGMSGEAPQNPVSYLAAAGASDDVVVTTGYPVDMILGHADIGGVAGRQVVTFDNSASGTNKGAASIATYTITVFPVAFEGWSGGAGGDTVLVGGDAFTLRLNNESGSVPRVLSVTKPY